MRTLLMTVIGIAFAVAFDVVFEMLHRRGKSCGTQLAHTTPDGVQALFDLGYTYAILGSDLFVLWKWAAQMRDMMNSMR